MPDFYKRVLAALAVGATFVGIAIALMVDAGVTARWNETLSRRDQPTEADAERETEAERE